MRKLFAFIVYLCMHATCNAEGQSEDILTPGIRETGQSSSKSDAGKRAYKVLSGVPDRFRFFYTGLGKRSGKDLSEDRGFDPHDMAIFKYLRNSHSPASLYDVWKPTKTMVPEYLNDRLQNTAVYRRLQMLSANHDKRDPELFSEQLYPIQSGKQSFETYLDAALDQMRTWEGNGEVVDEISTDEMAKQLNNDNDDDEVKPDSLLAVDVETPASGIKTKPFDLSFSSPDIDLNSYPLNNNGDSSDNKEANGDKKEKRWWASERLNKFRLPKSSKWSSRARYYRHVDPVLYFIGLGKK